MISTGNDIVALGATDNSRTAQYRFYSRIVSGHELLLYDDSDLSFPVFVWVMWSIKESVYKYISRSNPALGFAPLKISVRRLRWRDGFYEGEITGNRGPLYSRSYPGDGTILTVVSDEMEFTHTRWGMGSISDADYMRQSALARRYALESLSPLFPGAALRIVRMPDGPPEVWDGERHIDLPVSLAHHDRYVAWSYRLPANNSSYRKSAAN